MITTPRTSGFTENKPRTSLSSFGSFIRSRQTNASPLVSNQNQKPVAHPSTNLTPTIKAKTVSSQQPRVQAALQAANQASRRSATLLGGLTPRLRKYGLSVNGGGRSGVIGPRKVSGRLASIYRGKQT